MTKIDPNRNPEKIARFLGLALLVGVLFFGVWGLLFVDWGASSSPKESPPVSSPEQAEEKTQSPEEQPKSNEDSSITKKDIQQSETRAREFLQVYASFDGKKPLDYLEASKPYMTDDLYEAEQQGIRRPTYEVQEQQVMDIPQVDSQTEFDRIQWAMQTVLEITNDDNKKHREEAVFLLVMVKENGQWNVAEVKRRGSAG